MRHYKKKKKKVNNEIADRNFLKKIRNDNYDGNRGINKKTLPQAGFLQCGVRNVDREDKKKSGNDLLFRGWQYHRRKRA